MIMKLKLRARAMPLYEYRCEEDGTTITLLRPMADADKPVEDPEGKGRTFKRAQSTFSVSPGGAGSRDAAPASCPTCGLDGPCGL
jgi:putative FmdB family regulatory protein